MKKILVTITTCVCLFFSTTWISADIGPIYLNISNDLPNGYNYATVAIRLLDDFCTGFYDGVEIVVDANDSILIPENNYGIQRFGFNYDGDENELSVEILNDPKGKWEVRIGESASYGPFGSFMFDLNGTGSTRMYSLEITICGSSDLYEEDFLVRKENGCNFAAHIADFTFEEEDGFDEVDSAFFNDSAATLIELSEFETVPYNREVIILWSTESEVDNSGFNIYRTESEDGDYEQINANLISAEGSPTGGSFYEFVDEDVQNRKTYYYKLEEIDFSGKSTMHGPVSAKPRLIFRK
jgi:hypothetical protein